MSEDDEKYIHVRCQPELKSKVRAAAGVRDMNMSDFARDTLDREAEKVLSEIESGADEVTQQDA